jgi:hypothetical protein
MNQSCCEDDVETFTLDEFCNNDRHRLCKCVRSLFHKKVTRERVCIVKYRDPSITTSPIIDNKPILYTYNPNIAFNDSNGYILNYIHSLNDVRQKIDL